MELEDLKQQLNRKMTARQEHSPVQIASLLRRDTVSVVQKIRRSLRLELAISVAFTVVCLAMVVYDASWVYRLFFGVFSLVGIAFIIALSILLKKTAALAATLNVKTNLARLVNVMDEYSRRYLQLTLLLLPLTFGFALWLSYNDPEKALRPLSTERIIYLSLTMLALGTGMYYFTRWYLRKLYGNYIGQLRAMLRELEEGE